MTKFLKIVLFLACASLSYNVVADEVQPPVVNAEEMPEGTNEDVKMDADEEDEFNAMHHHHHGHHGHHHGWGGGGWGGGGWGGGCGGGYGGGWGGGGYGGGWGGGGCGGGWGWRW